MLTLTAFTWTPLFVLRVISSLLLFVVAGRRLEGVAYFTSWCAAFRVVHYTKPLTPPRGVHSADAATFQFSL